MLFSILEGSNLKRKRERPNKKQNKIFLVFLIIRKKRKQRENLFGFSNSKQKEQQKQMSAKKVATLTDYMQKGIKSTYEKYVKLLRP